MAQFAALGVAVPAGPEDDAGDAPIEVWDDHWLAFCIFRASGTQWRLLVSGRAVVHLGLDYPGVEVVMRHLLPAGADTGAVLSDLMLMEAAALPILNEVVG